MKQKMVKIVEKIDKIIVDIYLKDNVFFIDKILLSLSLEEKVDFVKNKRREKYLNSDVAKQKWRMR